MSEDGYPVNGYTRADNWLWDYVMPRARPNTFKIVAAVMRQTAGWHRAEARLTLETFRQLTGIVGQETLAAAVADALAQGFVRRRQSGRSYRYRLAVVALNGTEKEQKPAGPVRKPNRNGSGNSTETVQQPAGPVRKPNRKWFGNRTASSTETVHSTIKEKKGERKGKENFPPGGGETEPPSPPAFLEEDGRAPEEEPLAPSDTPYGVYQRLARLEPGIRKGQTLAEAKRLLAGDPEANVAAYSGEEIVACARFLQSEPWRMEKMVPLSTRHIMEKIDRWVQAGRPETWAAWEAQNRTAEPAGFAAIRAFLEIGD